MNATAPKCSCSCKENSGPPALVFACSGAADVGELADRAARLLNHEDKAWMSCLAGIGGRVSGPLANATAAPALLAIDGCPLDCARKTLELAGYTNVLHVRVTDLGFTRGRTPVSGPIVRRVTNAATALLKDNPQSCCNG